MRCLLPLAAIYKWDLQIDVNNTLLHGDLDEEVFMKLQLGFLIQETLEFANYKSPCIDLNKLVGSGFTSSLQLCLLMVLVNLNLTILPLSNLMNLILLLYWCMSMTST